MSMTSVDLDPLAQGNLEDIEPAIAGALGLNTMDFVRKVQVLESCPPRHRAPENT